MSDVGEDAFAMAVGRVTVGTLDRPGPDPTQETRRGGDGPLVYADLKEGEFKTGRVVSRLPCRWKVVRPGRAKRLDDREGLLTTLAWSRNCGAQATGSTCSWKGTALLQQNGFRTVVAETDSENLPFHAELDRAGYRHHGTMRCFRCDLT